MEHIPLLKALHVASVKKERQESNGVQLADGSVDDHDSDSVDQSNDIREDDGVHEDNVGMMEDYE